jgi:hypothetical protein
VSGQRCQGKGVRAKVQVLGMAKKEPTYDEAQIAEKLRELPGWYL